MLALLGGGEGEPLLEACAAERMEAVEERERLKEDVRTYLFRSESRVSDPVDLWRSSGHLHI